MQAVCKVCHPVAGSRLQRRHVRPCSRGAIITNGTFTQEAKREATRDGAPPLELIDSEKLIDMLEKLEVGLKAVTTYEVEHAFFNGFKAEPFAQVERQRQATGPGLAKRGKLSPSRA